MLDGRDAMAEAIIETYETTSSTMDDARRLAAEWSARGTRLPDWSAVVAREQTAGRGRVAGRRWIAARGSALLCTLALPFDAGLAPGFPIRVGLSVARAISRFAPEGSAPHGIRLKWPNDVLIARRKVAGILCERDASRTYVGMGVNLLRDAAPPELREMASSLEAEFAVAPEPIELLEAIRAELARALALATWREEAEAMLAFRGERIRATAGAAGAGRLVDGVALGLDEEGRLLVDTGSGLERLSAGELHA
jgi:BirA family biotin operon repressor/biotin-[acetyl-CoA-carboxylase] ligase